MRILLIGSGGREHALAWKLASSPLCERLFIAPGNPGTAQCGTNLAVDVADHAAVAAAARAERIDLVVVGPETPLVAGLVDDLAAAGVQAFGPSRAAAELEGSKAFTKELCAEAGIPTARFRRFTDRRRRRPMCGPRARRSSSRPTGSPPARASSSRQASRRPSARSPTCSAGSSARPGPSVVIEECLVGEEASLFALCDGTTAVALGTAQDHKRALDGDKGPNTGGMGAYAPAPVLTREIEAEAMREIVAPTLAAMRRRGTPFTGVLYAGLMITAAGPKLIEYNVRFGDPEAQVLMPRLTSDLVPALVAACEGRLADIELRWSADAALTVVLATKGYPGAYVRGSEIRGIAEAEAMDGVRVFHAGTRCDGGRVLADGGRVLNVTATGRTVADAQARAYAAAARIEWPEGFYRRDIGARAVEREGR